MPSGSTTTSSYGILIYFICSVSFCLVSYLAHSHFCVVAAFPTCANRWVFREVFFFFSFALVSTWWGSGILKPYMFANTFSCLNMWFVPVSSYCSCFSGQVNNRCSVPFFYFILCRNSHWHVILLCLCSFSVMVVHYVSVALFFCWFLEVHLLNEICIRGRLSF